MLPALPKARSALLLVLALPAALAGAPQLKDYDVVWTSPSTNSSESMPCGGGDIGLNVWVENGDLLVYLSRSGAFDELNGMPKLGRLRATLSPNPFGAGGQFRQELRLREGFVEVLGERGGVRATVTLWVDVFRPAVHIAVHSTQPTKVTAAYESWRLADREQAPDEMGPNRSYIGAPERALVRADRVSFHGDAVRFVHRDEGRTAFDMVVAQQGLQGVKQRLWNPLSGLTFGGSFYGRDFVAAGTREGRYASTPFRAWVIESRTPSQSHDLTAVLEVAATPSLAAWEAALERHEREADLNPGSAWLETQFWWRTYWDRSHVFVNPDKPDPASPEWQIGRNYQVFRYQLGCNAYGAYPSKFNGGLFTFDPQYVDPSLPYSPDYRKWGGGSFTAQNQRLLYWPMLKSGDFDLMRSQFAFYVRALGNAEARSEVYWGLKGASFTEQIENFGLPVGFEYGWKRGPGAERGDVDSAWINHEWDTVFEFCQMILEMRRYTGADIREYLPMIESCLSFYDGYYRRQQEARTGHPYSAEGKLVVLPGTALETYKDALNPTPTLAALKVVLSSLVELSDDQLPAASRRRWKDMLGHVPEIGFRQRDGRRTISPAWQWSHIQNVEIPQLYPVFPWGLYGIGRPDLQVAIDTWRYGVDTPEQKQVISWHQDAIFCARLGLTNEAGVLTTRKMADSGRRFPTWWGPGHDWVPDQNWGGSGMIGVQEMLLQAVGQKLYVLPAWPRAWDVDFKLHAPDNTTVEGVYHAGRIQRIVVSPSSRARDLVLPPSL